MTTGIPFKQENDVESLYYTLGTNVTLNVNYPGIKIFKKLKNKKGKNKKETNKI